MSSLVVASRRSSTSHPPRLHAPHAQAFGLTDAGLVRTNN
jgi:hypothetical protein